MVIRLGIIGLSADQGAWATLAHAGPLKSPSLSEKYAITALATSSPESAKAAAKAHGIPESKAYSSPEAIANDPDVDMVVVSVKLPLHKQLTIPALNAKKDLFVEWPLGNGLAEAEELAALAKKQGVRNIIGLQERYLPSVVKAQEIITSNRIGRVTSTAITTFSPLGLNPPTRASYLNDPSTGADVISVPMIHHLDPLCFLLGEFTSLSTFASVSRPSVQFTNPDGTKLPPVDRKFVDTISVHGVLENGAIASLSFATTTEYAGPRFQWFIHGTEGSLKFEGDMPLLAFGSPKLSLSTSSTGGWQELEFPEKPFGGVGEVYEKFVEGGKGSVDFEEAVKRHRMVDAMRRSLETGKSESYL